MTKAIFFSLHPELTSHAKSIDFTRAVSTLSVYELADLTLELKENGWDWLVELVASQLFYLQPLSKK